MKYARYLPEKNRRESWPELVTRNKNMHKEKFPDLSSEIDQAYEFVFAKKVLPSMRSLQFAGKPIHLNPARQYNCSYLPMDAIESFSEVMFLLLSGVGVGFSVQTHHIEKLPETIKPTKTRRYLIGDSIEGWSDAIKILIKAYLGNKPLPIFDFSDIRQKGARLITSGGKAPGPEPLKECLDKINKLLSKKENGSNLTSIEVHDINCFIADAVLAGGIRRSAMISLFNVDDDSMLNAKGNYEVELLHDFEFDPAYSQYRGLVSIKCGSTETYSIVLDEDSYKKFVDTRSLPWYFFFPERGRANNSAVILRHKIDKKTFLGLWKRIEDSGCGEPGFFFTNDKEFGLNPCAEISLHSCQFCNLVTINASDIVDQEDLNARAKAASFIATLQASYTDFHYLRDIWKKITEKEALIGVSMTGIASGRVLSIDTDQAAEIVKSENARVAKLIGINKAARCTTVKPEGCQVIDTMITTSAGILELSEMGAIGGDKWQQLSDIFVNAETGLEQASKFFNNKISDTKKIELDSGLTLESTYNHKYRIIRNNEYIWCPAEDLLVGDKMPYLTGQYSGGKVHELINDSQIQNHGGYVKKLPEKIILDEDFAWLLGLYFADGSIHKRGIRISGNWSEQKGFDQVKSILASKFGLTASITKHNSDPHDLRCQLVINSVKINQFLEKYGLNKQKSHLIEIPYLIRTSTLPIMKSFIDGFITGDGNICRPMCPTFVTTSKKFATQMVIIMRSIGMDSKLRLITSRRSARAPRPQYWVSVRQGRKFNLKYIQKDKKEMWKILDKLGLDNYNVDTIKSIQSSSNFTVDIEVPKSNTYIANSYVSHNTSSLVLGSSSGIHSWHDKFYTRRIRVAKNEAMYQYLSIVHPELLEDEHFRPSTQAVISVPQKAPDGAITRNESAIDLLNRVSKVYSNWVVPGHRKGNNKNNVSTTVSIKPNEWKEVGDWMWGNRDNYTALSVLPYDGGNYIQAPFQTITEKEYNSMSKKLHSINVEDIVELTDDTTLSNELACSSGNCEVK